MTVIINNTTSTIGLLQASINLEARFLPRYKATHVCDNQQPRGVKTGGLEHAS